MDRSSEESLQSLEASYLRHLSEVTRTVELPGENFEIASDILIRSVYLMPHARYLSQERYSTAKSKGEQGSEFSNIGKISTTSEPTSQKEGRQTPKESGEETAESSNITLPLALIFRERQHLVLLGEPGSGKTTALQYIAQCLANIEGKSGLDQSFISEKRIPIFIALKDLVEGKNKNEIKHLWLDDCLIESVSGMIKAEPAAIKDLLHKWYDDGRLILLLDGLDEVDSEARQELIGRINEFSGRREGKRSRIIITSRKEGYFRVGASYSEYELVLLDRVADLGNYTEGWIRALRPGYSTEDVTRDAKILLTKAESIAGLSQVIKIPLFLRLLIAQRFSSDEIGENRADLLRYYLEVECWNRGTKRLSDHPPLEVILPVLEFLAWVFQIDEEHNYARLLEMIRGNFPQLKDAGQILDFAIRGMGIMRIRGRYSPTIAFSLSTFQDYFAARHMKKIWQMVKSQSRSFVKAFLHHPKWGKPLLLFLHMLDETDATALIMLIWNAGSPIEEILHRDKLFVCECVKDGVSINDSRRREFIKLLTTMLLENENHSRPSFTEHIDLDQTATQTIESLLTDLPPNDKSFLSSYLLDLAQGKLETRISFWGSIRALKSERLWDLTYRMRSSGDGISSIGDRIYNSIILMGGFILSPANLISRARFWSYEIRAYRMAQRFAAIDALKTLGSLSQEWIDFLPMCLQTPDLCGVSAEIIGLFAPYNPELADSFIEAIRDYNLDYSKKRTVVASLGTYGQRFPIVVNRLLDLIDSPNSKPYLRTRSIAALGRSAETNIEAIDAIFRISEHINSDYAKADDDGSADGYEWALENLEFPSKEIILHLIDIIGNENSSRSMADRARGQLMRFFRNKNNGASDFLESIGSRPGTQFSTKRQPDIVESGSLTPVHIPQLLCKLVSEDGTLGYEIVDFTESILFAFRNFPISTLVNPIGDIVVSWSWTNPDILLRVIKEILESDALLLAWDIQESMMEDNFSFSPLLYLKHPIDPEFRKNLLDAIRLLRSDDKAVRNESFAFWINLSEKWKAERANETDVELPIHYLAERIEFAKMGRLLELYDRASWQLGGDPTDLSWNLYRKETGYILAALSCFRSLKRHWRTGNNRPSAQTLKWVLSQVSDHAMHLLSWEHQDPDEVVRILSAILNNRAFEIMELSKLEDEANRLMNYPEVESESRVVPERIAAAFALATFSQDYSQIEDILLAPLKDKLTDGLYYFHEGFIEILSRVHNARAGLVRDLLTIYHNESYFKADRVFDHLTHPSQDAIPILLQALNEVDHTVRPKILRALGAVKPLSKDLVKLFERYLRTPLTSVVAANALLRIKEVPEIKSRESQIVTLRAFETLIRRAKFDSEAIPVIDRYVSGFINEFPYEIAQRRLLEIVSAYTAIVRQSARYFPLNEDVARSLRTTLVQLRLLETNNNRAGSEFISGFNTHAVITEEKRIGFIEIIYRGFKRVSLFIAIALFFALSAVIPDLVTDLIQKRGIQTSSGIVVIVIFVLLSLLAAWKWSIERPKDK